MELTLLGTGAPTGLPRPDCPCAACATALGPGARAATALLIDGTLLLDLTPGAAFAAARSGHSLSGVRQVLLSHPHDGPPVEVPHGARDAGPGAGRERAGAADRAPRAGPADGLAGDGLRGDRAGRRAAAVPAAGLGARGLRGGRTAVRDGARRHRGPPGRGGQAAGRGGDRRDDRCARGPHRPRRAAGSGADAPSGGGGRTGRAGRDDARGGGVRGRAGRAAQDAGPRWGEVREVGRGRAAPRGVPGRAVRGDGRHPGRGHRVVAAGGAAPRAAPRLLEHDGDLRPRAAPGAGRSPAAHRLPVPVADVRHGRGAGVGRRGVGRMAGSGRCARRSRR